MQALPGMPIIKKGVWLKNPTTHFHPLVEPATLAWAAPQKITVPETSQVLETCEVWRFLPSCCVSLVGMCGSFKKGGSSLGR